MLPAGGEQRTGVSVADGVSLFDDEGYAQALRMGAWFDDAAGAAAAALEVTVAGDAGLVRDCPLRQAGRQ